jgi:Rieske Fe-S protein
MEYDEKAPAATSRRALLAVAGTTGVAVALGGCSTYDFAGGGEPPPPPDPAESGAGDGGGGGGDGGDGGGALAKTDDIPVGGGKIFADEQVVVTQPTEGDIKAFTAVCTHAGCQVASVEGGTINCTCHGSKFNINDGSVVAGPAPRALAAKKVTVDGDDIKLG